MKGWGQCPSVGPQGVRCGLPEGHQCQHSNGTLCRPWSDVPDEEREDGSLWGVEPV